MSSNLRVSPPGGDETNSVQRVRIDWKKLGRIEWSSSLNTLEHLALAGVQPLTLEAGLAIASVFELDRVGEERINSAMNNLRPFEDSEKRLYFGINARHFIRIIAESQSCIMGEPQPGVNCIALCSALSEVHDEYVAARILGELCKACSGVLSRTEFSHMVGKMLPHPLKIRNTDIARAEDIAKALQGLFRVSQGDPARIKVMGGENCAFIAGFAHWILNLGIYVEDEAGRLIYQDAAREEIQVVVTYCQQASLSHVQISRTTYILRDEDKTVIPHESPTAANLTFRTPWDKCLTRVFGTHFTALTEAPPIILGRYLGSVARICQALALGESDVGQFSRATYINFLEPNYGKGYINAVVSIFPELRRIDGLFEKMQLGLNVPFKEAVRVIERTVLDLEQLCQCNLCTHGSTLRTCKVALAFSIREMVSTLSCVKRDDEILPAVRGISLVHDRQRTNWKFVSTPQGRPLIATALDLGMEGVVGEDADRIKEFDLLSHPMELFGGYSDHRQVLVDHPHSLPRYRTAAVVHGLCYFLDCLQSTSSHPGKARTVHIVPGRIHLGYKPFNQVFDPRDSPSITEPAPATVRVTFLEQLQAPSIMEQAPQSELSIDMQCAEAAEEQDLILYYHARIPGGSVIRLRPGAISWAVLQGTGILTCKHERRPERLVIPCAMVQEGWVVSKKSRVRQWAEAGNGPKCLIWPRLDDFARCVAMQLHSSEKIVIRKDECLPCCTISLVRELRGEGRKELYHLM
ncbi:MAG: hypothetical protein Q9182_000360 [Xanthomendoza sp. 2 TL-2023]